MDIQGAFFISGIDTDTGKSVVTGVLAHEWKKQGISVVTQKLIQTGCDGISEDIVAHRKIMGIPLLPEDIDGTTCPLIFSYPASPHLAARIDRREADLGKAAESTARLLGRYGAVLVEGAGGLMVPLSEDTLTIDYVASAGMPVILVTTPRLGSINHTLLSLEALRSWGIPLAMLVYNLWPPAAEPILSDTREYLRRHLAEKHPEAKFAEVNDKMELKYLMP